MADALITKRVITEHGWAIELNKSIEATASKFGMDVALFIRVILPTLVLVLVGLSFNWTALLAGVFGYRACNANFQRKGLAALASLKARRQAMRTPPSCASADGTKPADTLGPHDSD